MKKVLAATLVALLAFGTVNVQAQGFLNNLKNKAQNAVNQSVNNATSQAVNSASKAAGNAAQNAVNSVSSGSSMKTAPQNSPSLAARGKTIYVSVSTGKARADGLSPENALKDLQKAIDIAEDGDVINVAEGNYLGNMDRGYVEIGRFGNATHEMGKFISIYGGWDTAFTERNVIKHITKMQPTSQGFTAPLFNWNARRPYGYTGPVGNVVLDGFVFDLGENNRYFVKNVAVEATGTPNEGVLTGRFVEPDSNPSFPLEGYSSGDEYGLHMDVEGNVRISNCIFVNCRDYGISALMAKGHIEICNNIFIACRYSACQVKGNVKDADIEKVSFDFHHNTVLFTWTRTKGFEDMGQGFRFMNGIRTINVYNNIFGCNSNCAVERVYYESNKQMEALKQSNLYDNYFFANRRDLELAAQGAATISVDAARIEEAEQIGPKYEGNKELPKGNDAFYKAIDQSYLEGYMTLKIVQSRSYDANSAANQVNRLFGLNQQGTEIVRPSMYCNKYPWEKSLNLWGKVPGYGAQMPK